MYFSTIEILPSIWKDGVRRDLLRAQDAYHGFMWSLFDDEPDATRDFIYRVDGTTTPPRFVVISHRKPAVIPGLRVQTKEFAPQLRAGDRLVFQTRVNPIVQRSRGRDSNSAKHDVVMDAKRLERDGDKGATEYERVSRAVSAWFSQREPTHGFTIEYGSFKVSDYRQHQLRRHPNRGTMRFSSVECEGVLTVTDPEKVRQLALSGLGSARGFGCGLLLLRRAP